VTKGIISREAPSQLRAYDLLIERVKEEKKKKTDIGIAFAFFADAAFYVTTTARLCDVKILHTDAYSSAT